LSSHSTTRRKAKIAGKAVEAARTNEALVKEKPAKQYQKK
jgi:hypothetical protein